jgi:8-oxo-dGTP diphosphatase
MKKMNLIAVLDPSKTRVLVCRRRKNPYQGLLNLVGGKREAGEDGLTAAYRELWEETGIGRQDIDLIHLMDFTYYLSDIRLEVYCGHLRRETDVFGEENELLWIDRNQNFFDPGVFAGDGNLGDILIQVAHYYDRLPAGNDLPEGE